MLARSLVLTLSIAVASCAAPRESAGAPDPLAIRSVEASDVSAYAKAATLEELSRLVDADLARRDPETADLGLDGFMRASVLADHATHAHALIIALRPLWRFQRDGGERYLTRIEQRVAILANSARFELVRAHTAVERNDLEQLRRLRADPRSVLGAETLALSSELAPHAVFVDGVLRFDALRQSARVANAEEARSLAAAMEACAPALESAGFGDASFAARVIAAEALQKAGLEEEAVERWLALDESRYFGSADESVQVAIAGRVRSFRERLTLQLRASIGADERRRFDAMLEDARMRFEALSVEQRSRIAELEAEVVRVGARKDEERAEALATQQALYAGTLERQESRIRELEELFVKIATSERRDWRSQNDALLDSLPGAIALTADVFTIWQGARALRGARPAVE